MRVRFSNYYGYCDHKKEISVCEDATQDLRYAIPYIAEDVGMMPTPLWPIVDPPY